MKTSIEIALLPLNAIEVVSQSPPEISINSGPVTTLEVALATIGPKGEQGDPGAVVGVETIVGNPNEDYSSLYQLFKQ